MERDKINELLEIVNKVNYIRFGRILIYVEPFSSNCRVTGTGTDHVMFDSWRKYSLRQKRKAASGGHLTWRKVTRAQK